MSGGHPPFKPSFGGKLIVAGCSDKSARANLMQEGKPAGPKLTTYARATAALEQYWAERAAAGKLPAGSNLPGGEKALAHKTREACWKDSVHLEHQPGMYIPNWSGTPADIEDKETVRTRGIPGYSGRQPPPGTSKPPPPAPDTSGWVAINAFDERRPRVKGIPGYTGHQPPSPVKQRAGQEAPAGGAQQQQQQADTQQLPRHVDQHRQAWGQPELTPHVPAQPKHYQAAVRTSSQHQQPDYSSQQQQQQYPDYRSHAPNSNSSAAAAAAAGRSSIASAGGSCMSFEGLNVTAADGNRPWSGVNASEASSTMYSPRFFMDGEELPFDRMQLQSSCSAAAAAAAGPAAGPQLTRQHGTELAAAGTAHQMSNASAYPRHVTGCCGGSGNAAAAAAAQGASRGPPHQQGVAMSSMRPASSPGVGAAATSMRGASSQAMVYNGQAAARDAVSESKPHTPEWQGPARTCATTYAASFNPASGFGLQQYMDSLQLAGSMRPASAHAAYVGGGGSARR